MRWGLVRESLSKSHNDIISKFYSVQAKSSRHSDGGALLRDV